VKLVKLSGKTMSLISKFARALVILFGVAAFLFFILPFWQIFAGAYEGGEAFAACWFFSGLFVVAALPPYILHQVTRTSEKGERAQGSNPTSV
jgi:hypothetical protein